MQVITLGSKTWDWGLMLTGLPLCLATRAANIFPLSRLANLRRKLPLSINLQACMRSHLHSTATCLVPATQPLLSCYTCTWSSASRGRSTSCHEVRMRPENTSG
jgi:hypothetical protein